MNNINIISVREHPEYKDRAVDYFSSKWGIDRKIYDDSITDSLATANSTPRWYLMLRGDDIIGSYGLIENDFMVRKDLTPWLCALHIEENERSHGLGGKLLEHGRREVAGLGFPKVYLCTDHVGYYERYGWQFFGMEESEFGGETRVYEIDSMAIILETPHLLLREMKQSDYPALAAILQDDQTMYAYEGAFDDAETGGWLDKNLLRYREDGIGLWAVILKDNGKMIGQAGLTWQDVSGKRVPEVGYLFNRAYWHKGYATEAAIACKEYGFYKLGFDEIYSTIRDTNIASMNVAIRNGMLIRERYMKHFKGMDMPHFAFSARRENS